ncbi:hypothetical protein BD410DRAFT_785017 [Rickenella mellea]|uniref:Uncharacterized protein n=1 Tax=Rickenella mellea TaxID=50990 RepID=A0A4Y7QCM9_9AGAM|nr:hypothetical protein BD410DRAFT_785017 [Rickenella mellea]
MMHCVGHGVQLKGRLGSHGPMTTHPPLSLFSPLVFPIIPRNPGHVYVNSNGGKRFPTASIMMPPLPPSAHFTNTTHATSPLPQNHSRVNILITSKVYSNLYIVRPT